MPGAGSTHDAAARGRGKRWTWIKGTMGIYSIFFLDVFANKALMYREYYFGSFPCLLFILLLRGCLTLFPTESLYILLRQVFGLSGELSFAVGFEHES